MYHIGPQASGSHPGASLSASLEKILLAQNRQARSFFSPKIDFRMCPVSGKPEKNY